MLQDEGTHYYPRASKVLIDGARYARHIFRAAEIAADNDLKSEQAKLADLQQRLDQLERQLEARPQARNVP